MLFVVLSDVPIKLKQHQTLPSDSWISIMSLRLTTSSQDAQMTNSKELLLFCSCTHTTRRALFHITVLLCDAQTQSFTPAPSVCDSVQLWAVLSYDLSPSASSVFLSTSANVCLRLCVGTSGLGCQTLCLGLIQDSPVADFIGCVMAQNLNICQGRCVSCSTSY